MSMLEIVNIIFVAETSAVFGLLYFLCLDEGMILHWWYKIIENKWIGKPLGTCQTCTMVWIGVLTFLIFTYCLPLFVLISIVSNGLLIFRKIA